jgi:hypothetical protein
MSQTSDETGNACVWLWVPHAVSTPLPWVFRRHWFIVDFMIASSLLALIEWSPRILRNIVAGSYDAFGSELAHDRGIGASMLLGLASSGAFGIWFGLAGRGFWQAVLSWQICFGLQICVAAVCAPDNPASGGMMLPGFLMIFALVFLVAPAFFTGVALGQLCGRLIRWRVVRAYCSPKT